MADTKQATAVAACGARHTTAEGDVYICVKVRGHEDYHSSIRDSIRTATGGVSWWDRESRTQPSQTELRIPDDLKRLCIACGEPADHAHKGGYSMCGACCAIWGLSLDSEHGHDVHEWIGKLIERIARLEGGR